MPRTAIHANSITSQNESGPRELRATLKASLQIRQIVNWKRYLPFKWAHTAHTMQPRLQLKNTFDQWVECPFGINVGARQRRASCIVRGRA